MRADEWIAEAEARLRETGVAEPRLDSQLLAAHALGQDRSWILAHPEADVPDGAADLLYEHHISRSDQLGAYLERGGAQAVGSDGDGGVQDDGTAHRGS